MLTSGRLFIHAPFKAPLLCCDPSFGPAVRACNTGPLCVSRSERKPAAFAALSADSGETRHDGSVRRSGVQERGAELHRWRRGGMRAPMWTAIFCLSLLMTERRIKGREMGQNGSQCGCTGVKHDQTAELNRGIIMPKMRARRRQRESEWHCFHILSPTHLTMQALCPSHYK